MIGVITMAKEKTPKKLTPKQQKFCEIYIQTGNASESARQAGYSPKTAFRSGQENMQKPAILQYIKARTESANQKTVATTDEILNRLTQMGKGYIEEEVVANVGIGRGITTTRIVKKKISARDQIKALELLGKYKSMWTEKQQIDMTVTVPQILDDIEDDEP